MPYEAVAPSPRAAPVSMTAQFPIADGEDALLLQIQSVRLRTTKRDLMGPLLVILVLGI